MENKIVDQKKDSQSETPFIQTWNIQEESAEAGEYLGCGCGLALGPNK